MAIQGMGESITITAPRHMDDYGRWIEDPRAESTIYDGCLLSPTRSQDMVNTSLTGEVTSWDVFMPYKTVALQRGQRVLARGEWFVISAVPFNWIPARRRNALHGTRFTMTRVEGAS